MAATGFLLRTIKEKVQAVRDAMRVSMDLYIPEMIISYETTFFIEIGKMNVVDSCESALHLISKFNFPFPLPGIEIETANSKVFEILQNKSEFTILHIKMNTSKDMALLAKFLMNSKSINGIEIRGQDLQHSQSMIFLEGLRNNKYVNCLNVSNNNLNTDSVMMIVDWMKESFPISLDVSYNDIDARGLALLFEEVENHQSLLELCCGDNEGFIDDAALEALRKCLKNNCILKKIDLSGLAIFPRGWKILSQALKSNQSLRHLILEGMRLTDAEAKKILRAIECHPNLMALNLAENLLTNKSAFLLKKMLMHNKLIEYLDIGYNNMTSVGIDLLKDKCKWTLNPNLVITFDLWSC